MGMIVINQSQTGLQLYCAWIGEIVPGCIDLIAKQSLRLCSLVFRTFPIESFKVKTDEPSFQARWVKLSLQYYIYKTLTDIRLQPNQHFLICGAFTFQKPALVFSKELYYHSNQGSLMRELRLWEEQQRTDNPPKVYGQTRGGFSFCWMVIVDQLISTMPHSMQRLPSELPRWSKKWYVATKPSQYPNSE